MISQCGLRPCITKAGHGFQCTSSLWGSSKHLRWPSWPAVAAQSLACAQWVNWRCLPVGGLDDKAYLNLSHVTLCIISSFEASSSSSSFKQRSHLCSQWSVQHEKTDQPVLMLMLAHQDSLLYYPSHSTFSRLANIFFGSARWPLSLIDIVFSWHTFFGSAVQANTPGGHRSHIFLNDWQSWCLYQCEPTTSGFQVYLVWPRCPRPARRGTWIGKLAEALLWRETCLGCCGRLGTLEPEATFEKSSLLARCCTMPLTFSKRRPFSKSPAAPGPGRSS